MQRERAELSMEIYKTLFTASVDIARVPWLNITVSSHSMAIEGPTPLTYRLAIKEDGFFYETLPGLEEHKTQVSGTTEYFLWLVFEPIREWILAQAEKDCFDMSHRKIVFNETELDGVEDIWTLAALWNRLVEKLGFPDIRFYGIEEEWN